MKLNLCHVLLTFILIFLLISIILLIIEVTFYAWDKNHDQRNNVKYLPKMEMAYENFLENAKVTFGRENPPLDAVWQKVNGSRNRFFVYSAFLDDRGRNKWIVRIIGATKTKTREKVICAFRYASGEEELINGKIEVISENWNLPYSAIFILCNIKNMSSIPVSVSVLIRKKIVRSKVTQASNHLLVNNIFDSRRVENEIAVCIKPLHYFDKSIQLIEFLELNMLLGVSHFTFYSASVGATTSCVLNHYMKQNITSMYSWKLDISSKTEIRTEGMFAALNDCLYRNMFKYSYVAFIDVDEFIVPHFNRTLLDLIKWLGVRYNTKNISSFSFQNAFFYLQWPDDNGIVYENELEKNLITLRKSRRKLELNAHKQRSKFIVKPRNVVEVGNHFVWQFFYNHNTLNVPSSIAVLNHYRVCEFDGDDCVHLPSTLDRTLHRYRKSLTCNIAQQWSSVQSRCNLPVFILESFNKNRCTMSYRNFKPL